MTAASHPRLVRLLLVVLLTSVVGTIPLSARADELPASTSELPSPPSADEAVSWEAEGTTATLDHVAEAVRATRLHERGLTGRGIGVALIDTGVAPVVGLTDVVHGPDISLDSQAEQAQHYDVYGHGTHLAGIITSDRQDAPGLAPDATLLSVKVGAYNGAVDVSQVIAGIDWVVQHREEHNIRVLVLAYGTDSTQDPLVDPLSHAVETAWHNGITVVTAAGNDGQVRDSLVNPATNPWVIAVGAVDTQGTRRVSDDTVATFSPAGTPARVPDVLAPGVGMVSARVPGGYLDTAFPEAQRPGDLFRGNGTSQAAAVVGAGVALMLEDDPSLTPDDVKARIVDGSKVLRQDGTGEAPGMLNLTQARTSDVIGAQVHLLSSGTGTLEGARGSYHLLGDSPLTGEQDIFGQPFDSVVWAAEATALTSWDGGTWNNTEWTGWGWDGWGWDTAEWTGTTWDGWGWDGWGWDGWGWDGWGWDGWGWDGWGWDGWGWDGWGWDGTQWD